MKGLNYYYCVWEVKTRKGGVDACLMEFTDNAMKGRRWFQREENRFNFRFNDFSKDYRAIQ